MRQRTRLYTGLGSLLLLAMSTAAFSEPSIPNQDGKDAPANPSVLADALQGDAVDGPIDPLWTKAQRMFAQNDFAQASAAADHVTSPALKPKAQAMINQIRAYVSALQDGVAAEDRKDVAGAIRGYTAAAHIKSDGPGDPSARIARLNAQAASTAKQAQQAQALLAGHALRLAQQKAKAAQLAKRGFEQEQAGDREGALVSLRAAEAEFPNTPGVTDALKRLKGELTPSQTTAATELNTATAIRNFYAGEFGKAEQELTGLAAIPDAKCGGAVYFYLGATRFERALLEADRPLAEAAQQPDVQAAFRQARALGYVPLLQFVSPTIMNAWAGAI